jgi:hypothetical protein
MRKGVDISFAPVHNPKLRRISGCISWAVVLAPRTVHVGLGSAQTVILLEVI